MKKYAIVFICGLAMFLAAGNVFAQAGFTGQVPGQQIIPGQQIVPGQQIIPGQQIRPGQQIIPGQYGYNFQAIPVVQAWNYGHKTPIVIQGNIIQFYGGKDLYIFRDSTGDILVKIGPKEWQNVWYQGINITPADKVEIFGEVHWSKRGFQNSPVVHVRFIKNI